MYHEIRYLIVQVVNIRYCYNCYCDYGSHVTFFNTLLDRLHISIHYSIGCHVSTRWQFECGSMREPLLTFSWVWYCELYIEHELIAWDCITLYWTLRFLIQWFLGSKGYFSDYLDFIWIYENLILTY